jgi:hypothetical protein
MGMSEVEVRPLRLGKVLTETRQGRSISTLQKLIDAEEETGAGQSYLVSEIIEHKDLGGQGIDEEFLICGLVPVSVKMTQDILNSVPDARQSGGGPLFSGREAITSLSRISRRSDVFFRTMLRSSFLSMLSYLQSGYILRSPASRGILTLCNFCAGHSDIKSP